MELCKQNTWRWMEHSPITILQLEPRVKCNYHGAKHHSASNIAIHQVKHGRLTTDIYLPSSNSFNMTVNKFSKENGQNNGNISDKKFQQYFEGQKKVRKLIANLKSFRNTSENKLVETTEGSGFSCIKYTRDE